MNVNQSYKKTTPSLKTEHNIRKSEWPSSPNIILFRTQELSLIRSRNLHALHKSRTSAQYGLLESKQVPLLNSAQLPSRTGLELGFQVCVFFKVSLTALSRETELTRKKHVAEALNCIIKRESLGQGCWCIRTI